LSEALMKRGCGIAAAVSAVICEKPPKASSRTRGDSE
jgi:hypothetical protein